MKGNTMKAHGSSSTQLVKSNSALLQLELFLNHFDEGPQAKKELSGEQKGCDCVTTIVRLPKPSPLKTFPVNKILPLTPQCDRRGYRPHVSSAV